MCGGGWETGAGAGDAGIFFAGDILRDGRRRAAGEGAGEEFIDQFVKAGLSAEVFNPGAGADARTPAADAQLIAVVVSDEPLVRLLHVCAADVARDGLSDHGSSLLRSESLTPLFHRGKAAGKIEDGERIVGRCEMGTGAERRFGIGKGAVNSADVSIVVRFGAL